MLVDYLYDNAGPSDSVDVIDAASFALHDLLSKAKR